MISFSGDFSGTDLKMTMPTADDWKRIGIEEAHEIRVRTETRGLDVTNTSFKAYSKAYALYRVEKGRGTMPNLSFSGRMLGALGPGVTSGKDFAKITISGEEGYKAWDNERMGREFLGMPDDRQNLLAETVGVLIEKTIE